MTTTTCFAEMRLVKPAALLLPSELDLDHDGEITHVLSTLKRCL